MRAQLVKLLERNQVIEMMYIAKNGEISKRRIKVTKITDDSFSAYCFLKHATRTFIIENVLVIVPVIRKEREVI
ncbi:transcriptional regulator [Lysinibacillus sp. SGAir0095]|uniref:transcriptional regulator n=1 Tax=Lysinibacillus sp. SGAir0095 TaxID=2070463 RepID=UPI0010CCB6CA|nr:transcriptional regulator [Lysinibacillus sp. SGAir0095]QCR33104.1 transcriptional regulator [Lysinibacillus sp. SGAir0095]